MAIISAILLIVYSYSDISGEEVILNAGYVEEPKSGDHMHLAAQIKRDINGIKAKYYSQDGKVDYKGIQNSEELKRYLNSAKRLQKFDLSSLKTRRQKLAFWINIYNSLVVHGVIATEVVQNVLETGDFFKRVKYIIGGYKFSLDDIEHGILRANRSSGVWGKPFSKEDPRLRFILDDLDPRIHFALVCGAKSCPPIGVYDEKEIDKQLDLAARSFINSEIEIHEAEKLIVSSQIFEWYAEDFGKGQKERLSFIIRYLDSKERKEFLERNIDSIKISYRQYDWSLNIH